MTTASKAEPLTLTYKQAGELLNLSEGVVKALVADGSLQGLRISPRVNRISREECERYAREGARS